MRNIGGTINVYRFEELDYETRAWAQKHYYEPGAGSRSPDEREKIKEYFEGVEFFEDGTIYEEI